jgi:hypothetical protein
LNIVGIFQVVINLAPTTSINPFEHAIHFYVEMPQNLTTPTNNKKNELVVNLDIYNLELNVLIILNQTQEL